MKHGVVVTKVHQVVEYESRKVFEPFTGSVTDARRKGDVDKSQQLVASTAKLVGNSFYGKTITDKTKHKDVTFSEDESKVSAAVRSGRFHSLTPLDDRMYELSRFKRSVSLFTQFLLF